MNFLPLSGIIIFLFLLHLFFLYYFDAVLYLLQPFFYARFLCSYLYYRISYKPLREGTQLKLKYKTLSEPFVAAIQAFKFYFIFTLQTKYRAYIR